MNTTIIIRVMLSAVIFLSSFTHQTIQETAHSTQAHTKQIMIQKKQTGTLPFVLTLLPIEGSHHSEHENGDVHLLCFDRIRRHKAGFSICCVLVKLILTVLYLTIVITMMNPMLHASTKKEGIYTGFSKKNSVKTDTAVTHAMFRPFK